jgi:hypothetical protein
MVDESTTAPSTTNQSRRTKHQEQSTSVRRTVNYALLTTNLLLVLVAGCATMRSSYNYRVVNGDCNCEQYRVRDGSVAYLFRARYRMQGGVLTSIDVELINNSSRDTLSTDEAYVKVSSLNISYQYNDRFLPLPVLNIPPYGSDSIHLTGEDVSGEDDWTKIAGERLTVTIKDLRLGLKTLKPQQVEFVPENPKLRSS